MVHLLSLCYATQNIKCFYKFSKKIDFSCTFISSLFVFIFKIPGRPRKDEYAGPLKATTQQKSLPQKRPVGII